MKVEMFSMQSCVGQQFRYSHNLPHTSIIMEVHRKPDLLASASFVLDDNPLFPSHSYPQLENLVPPDGMIACFLI